MSVDRIQLDNASVVPFLKGLLYLLKLCKQTSLPYCAIINGHILTAYDETPQDGDGTFLANLDVIFGTPVGVRTLSKDIEGFIECFTKHSIDLDKSIFIMQTNHMYDIVNTIFKNKLDKTANISIVLCISKDHYIPYTTFATSFGIIVTPRGGQELVKFSLSPNILDKLHTGIGRMILPSKQMKDQFSYDHYLHTATYSSKPNILPRYQYNISANIIDRIYNSNYPYDLDLTKEIWNIDGAKVVRIPLQDSSITGSISVSKNMLVRELTKVSDFVRLYIYDVDTRNNIGIFRFQGIFDGMVIATDGFVITV
jgi:hypothetical protein